MTLDSKDLQEIREIVEKALRRLEDKIEDLEDDMEDVKDLLERIAA